MSRVVVVDSSVAVKWFKLEDEEPDVGAALELLRQHRQTAITLAAPSLLRLEVLNALRFDGLNSTSLRAVAEALEAARLHWHGADAELSAHASEIAVQYGLTVYDSVFVALALRLDAELITADRQVADCGQCAVRLLGK